MTSPRPNPVAVVAVDGGNLKTDVALVGADGAVLAAIRGGTISHQQVGLRRSGPILERLLATAAARAAIEPAAGRALADVASFTVAGADFRRHETMLRRAYDGLGIADRVVVRNDAFAPLRAGTDGVGVAVICGSGINCAAVAPGGRSARFPALGEISGDWGGGGAIGTDALWYAVRARDGRGPETALARLVPAHFGFNRPLSVTFALEDRRLAYGRLRELAPVVLAAAAEGDEVARSIVDRQADEIVTMAVAALRRLGMLRAHVPVVLAGGVTHTEERGFWDRIRAGLAARAPNAELRRLHAPPVLGAALLGLDAIDLTPEARRAADARLRRELTHERVERLDGGDDGDRGIDVPAGRSRRGRRR